LCELAKRFIERKQVIGSLLREQLKIIQRQLVLMHTSALNAAVVPGMIRQDRSHDVRGNSKKMRLVLPVCLLTIHQAKICFMNQRSRLKCVILSFVAHVVRRQTMQLSINKRHKLLHGVLIASSHLLQ